MSSNLATPVAPLAPPPRQAAVPRPRRGRSGSTLLANGEPMIWLTGGALAFALGMIAGLLALVLMRGLATFWPAPVVQLRTTDGKMLLGEITRHEQYRPNERLLAELPEADAKRIRDALPGTDGI